jgi:conjugal transfer/entry exclusion protein
MKIVTLTAAQKTEAAALSAASTAAQAAARTAREAFQAFLNTTAGFPPTPSPLPIPFRQITLTDDGTSIVLG